MLLKRNGNNEEKLWLTDTIDSYKLYLVIFSYFTTWNGSKQEKTRKHPH